MSDKQVFGSGGQLNRQVGRELFSSKNWISLRSVFWKRRMIQYIPARVLITSEALQAQLRRQTNRYGVGQNPPPCLPGQGSWAELAGMSSWQ